MNIKIKDIKEQSKANLKKGKSVLLPKFEKLDENNYQFEGTTVEISSVKELNEYFKQVKEIKSYISQHFKSQIARVYESAFSSLAYPDGGFNPKQVSGRGGSYTHNQNVEEKMFNENLGAFHSNNLMHIFWGIKSNVSAKKYRPAEDVIDLLNGRTTGDVEYVLPQLTSDGNILVDTTKNSLSMNLVEFTAEQGEELQQLLAKDEYFADKQIELATLFSSSKKYADFAKKGDYENMNFAFYGMLLASSQLFGMDLGSILKKKNRPSNENLNEQTDLGDELIEEQPIIDTAVFSMPNGVSLRIVHNPNDFTPDKYKVNSVDGNIIYDYSKGSMTRHEDGSYEYRTESCVSAEGLQIEK